MRTPLLFFVALLGCSSTTTRPLAPPPPAAPAAIPRADREPTRAEIIDRALPSVVLLLNHRPDGSTVYGSGILVRPGVVLTSRHVVADARLIEAMLYKPGRTSYTPMDGGLARYLFENQADCVPARVVDGDAATDLAIVEIDADTSDRAPIAFATEPPKRGDRVLALGHPQETVWSFTEGVVGAIHQGAIQHDARISQGSSGGPLLNTRGEIVGVNVTRVASEADGLAFARPIELAARLLDAPPPASPLDLASPERAATSCWRAQERALPEVADCFDWDATWATYRGVAEGALRMRITPAVRARVEAWLASPTVKEDWIAERKLELIGYTRNQKPRKPAEGDARPPEGELPRELVTARSQMKAAEAEMLRSHGDQRGVRADLRDVSKLQARLKMGIRVDDVRRIEPGVAWVLLAGRNPNGSNYRVSELWAKSGERWLQRWPPAVADVARLPEGWPPPLVTHEEYRVKHLAAFLRRMADPGAPRDRKPADGVAGGRGGGSPPRAVLKAQ